MKFARIVFWIAAIWGVVILTPLYFIFDRIGRNDPPPITHPAFYYGFVSMGLAFQVAFIVIARDPVRLRPMMIPSALEKVGYGAPLVVLYLQNRLHTQAPNRCHPPNPAPGGCPIYKPAAKPVSAEGMGKYAIRFKWNDDHDLGIYSWKLLREVCPCEECKAAQRETGA